MKKRSRRRLRCVMRGYRYLKQTNRIGLIRELRGDLTNNPLWKNTRCISQLIYGAGSSQAELITRQYLLLRVGGIWLNKALLYSYGTGESPVIHPLPSIWQGLLIRRGIPVAKIRCSLMWAGYVVMIWAYGVLSGMRTILASLLRIVRPLPPTPNRFAYFHSLTAASLPQPGRDGRSHDIVTWYLRWDGRPKMLDAVCHGVRDAEPSLVGGVHVEYVEGGVPPLSNTPSLSRFTIWLLQAVCRSVYDALRGHWRHALLLAESSVAAQVRLLKPNELARDYLFHNSGHIYRPLWTYEARERGSRILLYFYSTSEQFKLPKGYEPERFEWGAMNWPHYLVWDTYQANLIQCALDSDSHAEIVGPIWFQSSAAELPEVPSNSVAVFDVQPHRSSAHFAFSTIADLYWGHGVENRFLVDIKSVLRAHRGTMVYKAKRDIGKRIKRSYGTLVERLMGGEDVISVNSSISPFRVIEACRAVISMPFTSTAIIGKTLGKPSVYYDPLGVLQRDDRGAHGVPILSGIDELHEWVMSVLKDPLTDC